MNLPAWFVAAWRGRQADARACLDQYAQLRQLDLVLQDIAMRGAVYSAHGATDAIELARAEGRRELALEILQQCEQDPRHLWQRIVAATPKPKPKPNASQTGEDA